MIKPGSIISYLEMCAEEGVNLQRGMNYRLNGGASIILMSVRANAPYSDVVRESGRVLIYEGHDVARVKDGPDPKTVDQPMKTPKGALTQNGLFYGAALRHRSEHSSPELVKVYEKIHAGIWAYNGVFRLVDAWQEKSGARSVFKFKLEITSEAESTAREERIAERDRLIPTSVKLEVWKRDKGRCVRCSSANNLHFDHIIPYSRGGSSLVAENIQLLCARHNLEKRDKIE